MGKFDASNQLPAVSSDILFLTAYLPLSWRPSDLAVWGLGASSSTLGDGLMPLNYGSNEINVLH